MENNREIQRRKARQAEQDRVFMRQFREPVETLPGYQNIMESSSDDVFKREHLYCFLRALGRMEDILNAAEQDRAENDNQRLER